MSMKYSHRVETGGSTSSSASSSYGRGGQGGVNNNLQHSNGPPLHDNNSTASTSTWTLKCTDLPQFDALQAQADLFRTDDKLHLRNLCNDSARCAGLTAIHYSATLQPTCHSPSSSPVPVTSPTNVLGSSSHANSGSGNTTSTIRNSNSNEDSHNSTLLHRRIILDYSRQRVVGETMELLFDLADAVGLTDRREAFKQGHGINLTTNHGKPVLHFLLRRPELASLDHPQLDLPPASTSFMNATMRQIVAVRRQIADFCERVRNGSYKSVKHRPFRNTLVICSSRGGYQSGPECVAAALEQEGAASTAAAGRSMRFLACADPTQVARVTHDWDAAETLVVLILLDYSTSEETTLCARSVQSWLVQNLAVGGITEKEIMAKHLVGVACADKFSKCQQKFGIRKENMFAVWDWVNPRYSLCSAAGLLPLSLQFSTPIMEQLLDGAHDMDEHFFHAPLRENLPVILGLLGVWNSTFLGYSSRVILPYADGLRLFPAHVQQVDMESNGKRVALDGTPLLHRSGEIAVTTAPYIQQQSMFQLLHQGRAIPADFIGFMQSQTAPMELSYKEGEVPASNHDELMSHFFGEPDALAYGKTLVDLTQEGTPEPLREHMVVTGNRPSLSLLLTQLDAFSIGQLLALYEHRTAVQGFLWGLNSFDQFGIELGRVLAKTVSAQLNASRKTGASVQGFNSSTSYLLEQYLTHDKKLKTGG